MLLERTLASFEPGRRVAVPTGDIQTDNGAQRLARYGFPVRQIATGGACHLVARMVTNAPAEWQPDSIDLLLIENVGNLVCPSSYDLGEEARVVLLSVTEGERTSPEVSGHIQPRRLRPMRRLWKSRARPARGWIPGGSGLTRKRAPRRPA